MEIEVLREFITLTQTLNYTKAAESLHLTQPTLSKHIVSMEKELGCPLLKRDRRRVELTDAGRVMAAAAMQIVDTFDDVQIRISELQSSKPIKVNGILGDTAIASITAVASTFMDSEGIAPVVYGNPSDGNFIEQLLADEIDIALTFANLSRLEELGLSYAPLLRSRFAALLSMDNSLARMKAVSIDDMRNLRFIKYADNYAMNGWANIEAVCRDHGFTPRTRTLLGRSIVNYTTVALEAGDVCILQASMPQLRYLGDISRVVALPVTDDDAEFRLYALYKTENYERVKPVLDAYAQARRVIINHGNDSPLVDRG